VRCAKTGRSTVDGDSIQEGILVEHVGGPQVQTQFQRRRLRVWSRGRGETRECERDSGLGTPVKEKGEDAREIDLNTDARRNLGNKVIFSAVCVWRLGGEG